MPGPGGGGRSGGGGRGGFSGGGFRGGHHHRPYMGGFWGFGPWYYGGGCLSGLISMALTPIILGVLVIALLVSVIFSTVSEISRGGSIQYDEQAFQAYTDRQYSEIFNDTAYEDHILLVVLTQEDGYDYAYIAWVGDHIADEVSELFGDNNTALGRAMNSNISNTDYTYSLDSDLGRVVKAMAQKIQALDLENNRICQEANTEAPSRLYNHTALPMTEETVNDALARFVSLTGIHCSIVVEDMEDVFGRRLSFGSILLMILLVVIVVFLVTVLVKKRRGKQDPDGNSLGNDRNRDPY